MSDHVFFEIRGLSTSKTVFCALIRGSSSVNAEMAFQMLCLTEWAPTLFTVLWLFSAVDEYMLVEIEYCDWREVAPFALIYLLFWCALLEWLPVNMHNRIVCTCVASRHCEWACAVSGAQPHQMNLHILHICELSPKCGWPCASSSGVLGWMTSHILSKCGFSLHCGWACVFSGFQFYQMISAIGHMCMSFHPVGCYVHLQMSGLTKWLVALDTVVSFTFALGYHVTPQFCATKWNLTFRTNVHNISIMVEHMTHHFVWVWSGLGTNSSAFAKLNYYYNFFIETLDVGAVVFFFGLSIPTTKVEPAYGCFWTIEQSLERWKVSTGKTSTYQ